MDAFSIQVSNELNQIRTSPEAYAKKIRDYKKYFKGTILRFPNSNIGIQTQEGSSAYEEAAEFLENHKKINSLQLNYPLCLIAKDFLKEVQKTDINKVNEIDLESIISKYGNFTGAFSRAIDFGGTEPEMVISNLLVSDGDESRSQRVSMFNENLNLIGVASGKHNQYGQCTIILTCTKFNSNNPDYDKFEFEDNKNSLNNQTEKLKSKNTHLQNLEKSKNTHLQNLEDPDCPEGVRKVVKSESEVVEGGKRKKIIKTVKYMEDGSVQTEIEKETIG